MNTAADMIDDDISSCLKEMTEQINKLQELRILAVTARFLDMTEEEYHKLCETPLRHTDTLGMLLGEKLKCIYDKRTPNAFCYLLSDGTRLRIPSSRTELRLFCQKFIRRITMMKALMLPAFYGWKMSGQR